MTFTQLETSPRKDLQADMKTSQHNDILKGLKLLNNENTFEKRENQETLARTRRKNSTIRNDALQTTDFKAFGKMYEYIQSDATTLDTHNESKVAAFYAGRSIFITGASGFVGKVRGCWRIIL